MRYFSGVVINATAPDSTDVVWVKTNVNGDVSINIWNNGHWVNIISKLEDSVSSLTSTVSSIGDTVSGHTTSINTINSDIDNLEAFTGYHVPAQPTFSFENNVVTISTTDTDADIYYKIGESGDWTKYTSTISISEDTTIYAKGVINNLSGTIVSESFEYIAPEENNDEQNE